WATTSQTPTYSTTPASPGATGTTSPTTSSYTRWTTSTRPTQTSTWVTYSWSSPRSVTRGAKYPRPGLLPDSPDYPWLALDFVRLRPDYPVNPAVWPRSGSAEHDRFFEVGVARFESPLADPVLTADRIVDQDLCRADADHRVDM